MPPIIPPRKQEACPEVWAHEVYTAYGLKGNQITFFSNSRKVPTRSSNCLTLAAAVPLHPARPNSANRVGAKINCDAPSYRR